MRHKELRVQLNCEKCTKKTTCYAPHFNDYNWQLACLKRNLKDQMPSVEEMSYKFQDYKEVL